MFPRARHSRRSSVFHDGPRFPLFGVSGFIDPPTTTRLVAKVSARCVVPPFPSLRSPFGPYPSSLQLLEPLFALSWRLFLLPPYFFFAVSYFPSPSKSPALWEDPIYCREPFPACNPFPCKSPSFHPVKSRSRLAFPHKLGIGPTTYFPLGAMYRYIEALSQELASLFFVFVPDRGALLSPLDVFACKITPECSFPATPGGHASFLFFFRIGPNHISPPVFKA